VTVQVQTTVAGTFNWQLQDVKTTPWPTAALPADLISGAASGSVTTAVLPANTTPTATFTVTMAAATAMHEGTLVLKNASDVVIATAQLSVEPDAAITSSVAPPPPPHVVRQPDGVGAGPKSFYGGLYNSDDLTVLGRRVDVAVPPLYDAIYGYSYDPPTGTATWSDADMTAGQKAMLSQRGVTTTYKRWGV
jgi:hypothetical protein